MNIFLIAISIYLLFQLYLYNNIIEINSIIIDNKIKVESSSNILKLNYTFTINTHRIYKWNRRIAVLILTCNRPEYLDSTLESLYNIYDSEIEYFVSQDINQYCNYI